MTGERVTVGATLTAFAMGDELTWSNWLTTAEDMRVEADAVGASVRFFAAIEVDSRGLEPFAPLVRRLEDVNDRLPDKDRRQCWWTFSIDDGRTEVTTQNRLRHIAAGRNLVSEFAYDAGSTHLLYLDADTRAEAAAVAKLLEVGLPYAGGHVPTYCLDGPRVTSKLVVNAAGDEEIRNFSSMDLRRHWTTAGFLMVERDVFKRVRWRYDLERGMTDDPAYAADCEELLGVIPVTRHDCIATHHPAVIPPLEYRGHDLRVER